MKDLQGRYVYVNHMVRGLPGYQSLGKTDAQIWPADLAAEYRANDQQVIAAKKTLHTVEHYLHEGKQRYMVGSKFPIFDKTGAVALVGGAGMDITERVEAEEALRESEEKFRQLAENIQEVFWMTTPAMEELLYVSPAYETVWGRSLESLRQRPQSFMDAIHAEDRERVVGILEGRHQQGFEVEYRIVRPDESIRWIRDRGFPVKDPSGKVYRIAGVAEDTTERNRVDEALRQSEFDLAEAQRVGRMGSWTLDIPTNTFRGSEEFYRIVDIDNTATGISYDTLLSRVHPDDRARNSQAIAEAKASGKSFEFEHRIETRSGQLKHLHCVGYAKTDSAGAISSLFGSMQDITERKQAEIALRDSGVQLQALSRRLVELQEFERKELARELHDRIGQSLTALNINLNIMRTALPLQASDELRARLADSETLIESTTAAIGNVVSELRPPMLDDHGLASALDWYAKQFSARTGISVAVRGLESAERPASDTEIVLFRIVQEALNNVLKHARASRVEITLGRSGSDYVMSVQDDGVGYDAAGERAAPHTGLGMVTMRERAQAVGGRFEVRAASGDGTRVTVRVPA
jgi:PAS domain S-box-containing protein